MKDSLRKLGHFSAWISLGLLLHSLVACVGRPSGEGGDLDQGGGIVATVVGAAQAVAVAAGQPWAVPVFGGLGALYHAIFGVPGVPAVTERVKRKRAVKKAQREAEKAP